LLDNSVGTVRVAYEKIVAHRDEHRTLPLSVGGGSKTQKAVFRLKLHFSWRKCATMF